MAYNTRAMTILDHRFTMNNRRCVEVNSSRSTIKSIMSSMNNDSFLRARTGPGCIHTRWHDLSYHGTHQLSSVLVLSRHASETWSLDFEIRTTPVGKVLRRKWSMTFQLRRPRKKVGGKKAHVQFMGVDDVQCQEVDMTVRVFIPGTLTRAYYRYWSDKGGKVIGSLMWTRTKSREPNTLGICWAWVTSGDPTGSTYNIMIFTVLQPLQYRR
jgi:hypothetical protein